MSELPAIFDCGCSRLKVAAGRCDIYGPDGRLREVTNLFGDEEPEAPPANTIEVYVDSFGRARCTGPNCGKQILWATVVRSGRKMCFDDPDVAALRSRHEPATNRLIYALPLDGNHWAVCPDRERFKR